MEKIKFRAWYKSRLTGKSHMLSEGKTMRHIVAILHDPGQYGVMQYTGLKDKNGKEIYEGDVVKCYDDIWQIVWDEEQACFTIESIGETIIVVSRLRKGSDCVVIGNIYENPELLKEE